MLGRFSDHVQFSSVLHQAGDGVRREHTGGQGEVGVDHRGELSDTRVSDGRVKTGPEHPQEDGSCVEERDEETPLVPLSFSSNYTAKLDTFYILGNRINRQLRRSVWLLLVSTRWHKSWK